MTSIPLLNTNRLLLREFRESDLDAYADICADPEVTRYIGDLRVLSRSDAWRQMAVILGHWRLRGYGIWAVEEKDSGELIGRIGLWQPEGWPGFELGWVLGRTCWGRGYATEGASAALDFAFETLRQPEVISLIHPDNAASVRVAQRLGETLNGEAELYGHRVLVYRITRPAWAELRHWRS